MSKELEKRLARETLAREEAERLLEEKSLELYHRNQELEVLLQQQKNEKLQLFENTVFGIALTYEGILLDVNSTFVSLLGYSNKDEIRGITIAEISHPDDAQASMQKTKDLHSGKIQNFALKKRYQRKDGTYLWAMTSVSDVKDEKGNTKYHLAIILDQNNEIKTQRKLELSVNHLKEINQNLEQFAYIVSHDLKAPLNGINTVVNWLKEKDFDEETTKYISLIEERSSQMNTRINELLNYSQSKLKSEHNEPVDMEVLISEVVKMFVIPSEIRIELKGDFPVLNINPAKMQQVFSNLIDNSIRFIDKPKGYIKIEVRDLEEDYQFLVFDNGKGIPEDRIDEIFELQQEGGQFQNQNSIGLPLVKRIIEQYNGVIKAQSEPELFTEISFTLDKDLVSSTPTNTEE